jgi:hypothetical protein
MAFEAALLFDGQTKPNFIRSRPQAIDNRTPGQPVADGLPNQSE